MTHLPLLRNIGGLVILVLTCMAIRFVWQCQKSVFYCYKPYNLFERNSSLVTLRFNTLTVNEIWRDELTFSLITLGCFGQNVPFPDLG